MAHRSFKPYAGPESFTAFKGDGTLFKISESAAPELHALAKRFPEAFSKALKSLGWFIRGEMKTALVKGGPAGAQWPELSKMHIYRRLDLLKAGQADALTGAWTHGRRFRLKKRLEGKTATGKERMMDRWQGRGITRGRSAMGGRLTNAIRYKTTGSGRVDIGALSPSAAMFLDAVQSGKRGSRGAFQFTGEQPVTPAMRRAFWAAGVPLAKETTVIKQDERPLVDPVFRTVTPEIERYMVGKITAALAKQGIDWMQP